MYPILHHPILDIPEREITTFEYKGQQVKAAKGYTIAAALHQAGFPIHSHSLKGRERSMDCGIGKCGACEMLVDGVVKRICVTLVDGVKKVEEIAHNYLPETDTVQPTEGPKVYKTEVAIIGAGPAGLACREQLNKFGIPNIVIDNNDAWPPRIWRTAASSSWMPTSLSWPRARSRSCPPSRTMTCRASIPPLSFRR